MFLNTFAMILEALNAKEWSTVTNGLRNLATFATCASDLRKKSAKSLQSVHGHTSCGYVLVCLSGHETRQALTKILLARPIPTSCTHAMVNHSDLRITALQR